MSPPPHPDPTDPALSSVRIELLPLGKTLLVPRGTPLQDPLFDHGAEFPCGGRGRCKGCRIRVLAGRLPATSDDEQLLTRGELAEGWRLGCRARADQDLKLELAQWEETILADDSVFPFSPQEGWGVAVDLGTTTIVAQLLDLCSGHVLAVRSGLNQQAKHGADIMSRVDFAGHGAGQSVLQKLIRAQIGRLIAELLGAAGGQAGELKNVVLVGNSVMHHLFSGIAIAPLASHPFEPVQGGLQMFASGRLGWPPHAACTVRFLPCLGGFVGSDILAGILATRLHETDAFAALIDLGTNGEIVVGNRQRLLCASTAAGPAFEGARIAMGMRAAAGAIAQVTVLENQMRCRVLGNVNPRGICGSGLVDAAAAGLELGLVRPDGKLARGSSIPILAPVELCQSDLRELQLAKGAITAGLRILVKKSGATLRDLSRIYLAGAFGNYINRASARRIGLLPLPAEKVLPAGNTALLGAKMALFSLPQHGGQFADLRKRIEHVPLNADPQFQEVFLEEMAFPARSKTT